MVWLQFPRILNINGDCYWKHRRLNEKLDLFERPSTRMDDLAPLPTSTNEAKFNAFLVKIAAEITREEVREMKFLCLELSNNLRTKRLDEIKQPREFVNFLRKRGIISLGVVDFLIWLLKTAGNKRLADMINERGKQLFQFTSLTCSFNHPCCPLHFLPIFCSVDHALNQIRDHSLIKVPFTWKEDDMILELGSSERGMFSAFS